MRIPIAVALLVVLVVPFLPAQAPQLTRGARIRVRLPEGQGHPEREVSGALQRVSGDSVYFMPGLTGQEIVDLHRGGVLEMAVLRANPHGAAGAGIGACVGIAAAIAIRGGLGPSHAVDYVGAGGTVLLGAVGGALLGYIWGHSLQRQSWVVVQTSGVQVSVVPTGLRLTLGVVQRQGG